MVGKYGGGLGVKTQGISRKGKVPSLLKFMGPMPAKRPPIPLGWRALPCVLGFADADLQRKRSPRRAKRFTQTRIRKKRTISLRVGASSVGRSIGLIPDIAEWWEPEDFFAWEVRKKKRAKAKGMLDDYVPGQSTSRDRQISPEGAVVAGSDS